MTLTGFLWLFPLLFVFHDLEEIVVVKSWVDRNRQDLTARFPSVATLLFRTLGGITTSAFALGVAEEFVLLVAVTAVALATGFHALWFGLLVAFTVHLVVHCGQAVVLRRYVPGLLTGLVCIPAGVWMVLRFRHEFPVGGLVLWSVAGVVLMVLNLMLVHRGMKRFSDCISRPI